MEHETYALGQLVGLAVPDWKPARLPFGERIEGRFCVVERLEAERHAADLHAANAADAEGRMWTYMGYGPFASLKDYRAWVEAAAASRDPVWYAVIDKATGKAAGVASYLRIDAAVGSIEVGHIAWSPQLQRTPAATEAMYLMMENAFALGYRRYEWKCNALNAPSRAAAQRLGFSYEGVFRQARIDKGRNRDTAWYAIIDKEWPALQAAFRQWLAPANFDGRGRQRARLSQYTSGILKQRG
jgi:RimJ/RimL family protein N-acetyltransferase